MGDGPRLKTEMGKHSTVVQHARIAPDTYIHTDVPESADKSTRVPFSVERNGVPDV